MPSLVFTMTLPTKATSRLVGGILLLRDTDKSAGIKVLATSGLPSCQYQASWNFKQKGCLPPTEEISPAKYTVSTQRLNFSGVKGVKGGFYPIAPFEVNLPSVVRGDFGIHHDAGVPGSAGCVVVRIDSHWRLYEDWISAKRLAGHQSIPLTVIYPLPP